MIDTSVFKQIRSQLFFYSRVILRYVLGGPINESHHVYIFLKKTTKTDFKNSWTYLTMLEWCQQVCWLTNLFVACSLREILKSWNLWKGRAYERGVNKPVLIYWQQFCFIFNTTDLNASDAKQRSFSFEEETESRLTPVTVQWLRWTTHHGGLQTCVSNATCSNQLPFTFSDESGISICSVGGGFRGAFRSQVPANLRPPSTQWQVTSPSLPQSTHTGTTDNQK